MLYNVNRRRGTSARQWSDFFKPFEFPEAKGWEELLAIVEDLNTAFGGQDLRTPNA